MDQKNLLLAIVISVVILIGFQFLFEKMRPPAPVPAQQPAQTSASSPSKAPDAAGPTPSGTNRPAAAIPNAAPAAAIAAESREQALAQAPRVKIDTSRLHGSINLQGGRIDDLTLANYHESVDPKSPEVVLLYPSGTADPYFAEFGWVAANAGEPAKLPGPDTKWTAAPEPLTPTHPAVLTWDNGAGLVFTRTIAVDQNYMFTVTDAVQNNGSSPVALRPYALDSRTGVPEGTAYYILHEGLAGYLAGHVFGGGGGFLWLQDPDTYAKLESDEPRKYSSTGGWIGFTDKYWLTALIPPQDATIDARVVHSDNDKTPRFQADYLGPAVTAAPGASATSSTRFFAGAKEVDLLDAYRDQGIAKFDLAIDWGLYYFITKPIFFVLRFFHGILGNFGLAILLLTLLIKLAFFPLANKSYAGRRRA
jgi:YidC/Oxa1 family membrane protein insertase